MYVNNMYQAALRISLAGVPEFYAVLSSHIEALPHQIDAVYHEMLNRLPLRFLLADDPGAGKTIMTGLLIKELLFRKKLSRVLIVSPGNLAEQWIDEMTEKFCLDFSHLSIDEDVPDFCIARLDSLARNKDLLQKAAAIHWDLAVIDEAHKLSAQLWGNEIYYTKRYQVGRALSESASNFLMLTATPHNGKFHEYRLFMAIISKYDVDPLRYMYPMTFQDKMRRLLKEDIITFTGEKLFPEREAYTISYKLSPQELALYEHVTQYVRDEFDRVDRLEAKYRHSIGFALTILQRRLASSPEAICKSLHRRLDRLKAKLVDYTPALDAIDYDTDDDTAADFLTASQNASELTAEIDSLRTLAREASDLRASGQDVKWRELSRLLQNESAIIHDGIREKIIIFTEHRDTLNYLADRIRNLLGNNDALTTIHGGMSHAERRRAANDFMTKDNVSVLVATDAAGEGINLQCSHIVINYDLPWNPNRLEQRFGRIHRIGQKNTCYLWNLVAHNTREGRVLERLLAKIDEERKALGGQVFDVLGSLRFGGVPLQEMIINVIRTEKTPYLKSGHVKALLETRSLFAGKLSPAHARALHSTLLDSESRLLHPSFIEAFFLEAFPHLHGSIYPRGEGIYEITYVPQALRSRDSRIRSHYRRVCFDRKYGAYVIIQGNPLLMAVTDAIIEEFQDTEENSSTPEGRSAIEQAAMNAVMKIELSLGNSPQDVASQNLGYDIESATPEGTLRLIEVKGREKGADTVTVTTGEIHTALRNKKTYILAIIEVHGDNTHTTYLSRPFRNEPDEAAVSVTFSIPALVKNSECIYKEEED